MRISTFVHGILDYLTGLLLVSSPWLLRFGSDRAEATLAWGIGGALIFLSLITDYELAVLRFVPFPGHRFLDIIFGILLMGAPIHFATSPLTSGVFVAAGLLEFGAAILTRQTKTAGRPLFPGGSV